MLNKPKFMSPSTNMYGNNVIDLNEETLPFSCIVDGNEAVVAWQIVVSKLSDNAKVFDTGKRELNPYFYPVNNRNQNVTFNINLKECFTKISDNEEYPYIPFILNTKSTYDANRTYYKYDESNDKYSIYEYKSNTNWKSDYSKLYIIDFVNHIEPYYWTITLWGSMGSLISSVAEVFYANTKPKITLKYSEDNETYYELKDGQVLDKRKYYFKADYSQDENILLKKYGWRITDSNNNKVIMNTIDSNQIYGLSDNISCQYNGFINNSDYNIELYLETQNGYFSIIKNNVFKIQYQVKTLITDFDIEAINSSSCIMLDWGNLKTTEGIVSGKDVTRITNYPIASYEDKSPNGSNSIKVKNGSSVLFEGNANAKLEIPEDSYTVLSFQITKDRNTTLLKMSGVDELSYNITRKLDYISETKTLIHTIEKNNGDFAIKKIELSNRPSDTVWYVVTLYPILKDDDGKCYTDIKVVESVGIEALYPDDDNYPGDDNYPRSDDLYPYNGKWK